MPAPPLISVGLAVYNGLPHVRDAIDALSRQTYRNFEVLVQDACSTDGSTEYLRSVTSIENLHVISEKDGGHADGWNRTMKRANGDLFVFAACDEILYPDALSTYVKWYAEHPGAAYVCGPVHFINADLDVSGSYVVRPFNFMKFVKCEEFLSFGGYANRHVLGEEFYYDAALKTCPDYDFFIRIAERFGESAIVCKDAVTCAQRDDAVSMSNRVETFGQFVEDKAAILDRFLTGKPASDTLELFRRTVKSALNLWAAESAQRLGGDGRTMVVPFLLAATDFNGTAAQDGWEIAAFWRQHGEFPDLQDRKISTEALRFASILKGLDQPLFDSLTDSRGEFR